MKKIFWKSNFSVQSRYIDQQHQNLLMILNDFNESINQGKGTDKAFSILNRLVQYAEEHFRDEELLMETARFPQDKLNAHKNEHEKLTQDIFQLCENWSSRKKESLPEISHFLEKWLLLHILKTDMEYSKYVDHIDDSFMFAK